MLDSACIISAVVTERNRIPESVLNLVRPIWNHLAGKASEDLAAGLVRIFSRAQPLFVRSAVLYP